MREFGNDIARYGIQYNYLSPRQYINSCDFIVFGGDSVTSSADFVMGGAGNDYIYGYEGNDTIYGGAGVDILYGGAGKDVFIHEVGDGSDRILNIANDNYMQNKDDALSNGIMKLSVA